MARMLARHCFTVCWFVLAFAAVLESRAQASTGLQPLSQMAHRAWRIREARFLGTPNHFAQTADGYLWVTSSAGLQRFNGEKFSLWQSEDGFAPQLPVNSILAPSTGGLWLGTGNGAVRVENNRAAIIDVDSPVTNMVEDRAGRIWAARMQPRASGPICQVTPSTSRCEAGLASRSADYVAVDASDHIWIGSHRLCSWDGHSCTDWLPETGDGITNGPVTGVAASPDGSIWATRDDHERTELDHFVNGTWKHNPVTGFALRAAVVNSLYVDPDGCLWIGTAGQGLFRIHDQVVEHMDSKDGLSGNDVTGLFMDREKTMWLATEGGVYNLQILPVADWTAREGLSEGNAISGFVDRNNRIFLSHLHSIDILEDGHAHPMPLPKGARGPFVLFRDEAQRLWIGGYHHVWIMEGTHFRGLPCPPGLHGIYDLVEDSEHTIWVRSSVGIYYVRERRVVLAFPDRTYPQITRIIRAADRGLIVGLHSGGIAKIWVDHFETLKLPQDLEAVRGLDSYGGLIWVATDRALSVWRDGLPNTIYREEHPEESLHGVIADVAGNIWFWCANRIMMIRRADIEEWRRSGKPPSPSLTLDAFDGVHTRYGPFGIGALRDREGRIWLLGSGALQEIDPSRLVENRIPPTVKIERIFGDHKEYRVTPKVDFPRSTHDMEVDYAALSFTMPEKIRFRYRMIGLEKDWHDAGDRRQAFYTNLRPGNYTFQVVASNSSGIWNPQGAQERIHIQPTLLESTWFRSSLLSLFCFLSWAAIYLRIRGIRLQAQTILNERLLERERIARTLHDTLLQGMQILMLRFHAIGRTLPADAPAQDAIVAALVEAERVLVEGREHVFDLRKTAPHMGALSDQLQSLVAQANDLGEARLTLCVYGQPRELNVIVQEEVFLICREALLNSCKHACASLITCTMRFEAGLTILCADNGTGMNATDFSTGGKAGHFGLIGMRERAHAIGATLTWRRGTAGGTEVELLIPEDSAFKRRSEFGA